MAIWGHLVVLQEGTWCDTVAPYNPLSGSVLHLCEGVQVRLSSQKSVLHVSPCTWEDTMLVYPASSSL